MSMLKQLCIAFICMNVVEQPPMSQVSFQRWPARIGDKVHVVMILRRLRMPPDVLSNVLQLLWVPTILISQDALSKRLVLQEDMREGQCVADLKDFENNVSIFDEWQRFIYVRGVRCFFAMFECKARCLNLVSVFEKIYEEGLIHIVFRLEIMHMTSPWARHVLFGFYRLLEFLEWGVEVENRADIEKYVKECKFKFVRPRIDGFYLGEDA